MHRRARSRWALTVAVAGLTLTLLAPGVSALGRAQPEVPTMSTIAELTRIPFPSTYTDGPFLDPDNGNLYLTSGGTLENGTLTEISGATNSIVGTATVGWNPAVPAVATTTGALYVSNLSPGVSGGWGPAPNVTVVSGTTNRAIASISTGANPASAVYDSATGLVYVPAHNDAQADTGWNTNVISSLTNRIVFNLTVGTAVPEVGFFDPGNEVLYFVADGNSTSPGRLTAISGTNNSQLFSTALPGNATWEFLLDPWTGGLYIPCSGGVAVISNQTKGVVQTIALDSVSSAFMVNASEVGFLEPGVHAEVYIVATPTNSIVRAFPVGAAAAGTYDPVTGEVYTVAAPTQGGMDVVNVSSLLAGSLVQSLELDAVGEDPSFGAYYEAPVYDPGNGQLYVLTSSGGPSYLYVFSTNATQSQGSPSPTVPLAEGLVAGIAVAVVATACVITLVRRRSRQTNT